jgi:hypothetical protein
LQKKKNTLNLDEKKKINLNLVFDTCGPLSVEFISETARDR